ncbi:MAG: DUF4388 domain-containing protein [Planctomycetota bacterium]|nr:DUF4388 domain-containing protein [Planctomycetota bacterium]
MSGPDTSANDSTRRREVLLISADSGTLAKLAGALQREGETALTCGNIQDAWECLRGGSVGIVVLDLTSPTLDEFAFFRAARSAHNFSDMPFLLLIRRDYQPPVLASIGGESIRDAWLTLPCPTAHFMSLIRSLRSQPGRTRDVLPLVLRPTVSKLVAVGADEYGAVISAPPAAPGIFEGQLGAIDVTKILSMLEPLKLTGILAVSDDKRDGRIFFVEGSVHHATLHDIEGADALFLLFHMRHGRFHFQKGEPVGKRTIQGNTMQLLLEGLRQMDEAKAAIRDFQKRRVDSAGELDTKAEEVVEGVVDPGGQ